MLSSESEETRKIKETGVRVFAQNEESCVVYGMSKAVLES